MSLMVELNQQLSRVSADILEVMINIFGLDVSAYRISEPSGIYGSSSSIPQYESQPFYQGKMLILGVLGKDFAKTSDSDKEAPSNSLEKRAYSRDYLPIGTKIEAELSPKTLTFRVKDVWQDWSRLAGYYEYLLEPL